MKAILNMDKLLNTLSEEDPLWQEKIYARTGVIPVFKCGALFSNCGYIDLDRDAEYCYVSGEDRTEYCEINSISEFVEYILEMESYQEFLVDVSLGRFTKADLFWAVYSTIINPVENRLHADGSIDAEWGLYSIRFCQEHLELNMAVIACGPADLWIDIDEETELPEALNHIVEQMNMEDLPKQKVFMEYLQKKPTTFEELKKKLELDGEFNWLHEKKTKTFK